MLFRSVIYKERLERDAYYLVNDTLGSIQSRNNNADLIIYSREKQLHTWKLLAVMPCYEQEAGGYPLLSNKRKDERRMTCRTMGQVYHYLNNLTIKEDYVIQDIALIKEDIVPYYMVNKHESTDIDWIENARIIKHKSYNMDESIYLDPRHLYGQSLQPLKTHHEFNTLHPMTTSKTIKLLITYTQTNKNKAYQILHEDLISYYISALQQELYEYECIGELQYEEEEMWDARRHMDGIL